MSSNSRGRGASNIDFESIDSYYGEATNQQAEELHA